MTAIADVVTSTIGVAMAAMPILRLHQDTVVTLGNFYIPSV
jgi:hypothetical protein